MEQFEQNYFFTNPSAHITSGRVWLVEETTWNLQEAVTKGMFIVKRMCSGSTTSQTQPNENNTVHFAAGSPHWPLETSGLAN